jgi:tRNA dimethylallyltransferase
MSPATPAKLTAAVDMTESENAHPLLALIGPTASGKSDVALRLAQRLNGEILSADSMQVYRGLDVGTAKPTADERRTVRHHLVDLVDPDQTFTVARFAELADAVISDARRRGVTLVVTGGTPLYFKALFTGLFGGPGADENVRARLNAQPTLMLHERLTRIDPPAAARIHASDRKRLVRALEVFELTGQPISSFQTSWRADTPAERHPARWFGLSWDRESLSRRINSRVKQMIADGWVEETRSLLARHGQLSKTAAEATGYAELIEHILRNRSLDEAVEQIKIATRQLARRQMKWFRRFPNVTWLPGNQSAEDIAAGIVSALCPDTSQK